VAKRSVDVTIRAFDRASPAFRSAGAASQGMASRLFTLKNAAIASVAGFVSSRLAGAVKSYLTHFSDLGDAFEKWSKATGMSTELLSGLSHAASMSGSSFENIRIGLKTFTQAAYDASRGGKTQQEMFKALGLSVTEADGSLKTTDRLLYETADAMKSMSDGTARVAIASKLFGRSGLELLPMLVEGSKGIRALTADAERLGIVWSQQDAEAAAKFQDSMTRFKQSLVGVGQAIFVRLAGPLTALFDRLTDWFVRNRETIVSWALTAVKWLAKIGNRVWSTFESLAGAFNSIGDSAGPVMEFLKKGLEGVAFVAERILLGLVGIVAAMEAIVEAGSTLLSGEGLNAAIDNAIDRFSKRVLDYAERDKSIEKMFRPSAFARRTVEALAGAAQKAPVVNLRPSLPMPQPVGTMESRYLTGYAEKAADQAKGTRSAMDAIRKEMARQVAIQQRIADSSQRTADALENMEGVALEAIN
jgi:hypothetical protein